MKRILLAFGLCLLSLSAQAATCSVTSPLAKDATASPQTFNVPYVDDGSGSGACEPKVFIDVPDGKDVTQGAKADAAWVSGSGSVIAILKNIAAGIASALAPGENHVGEVGSNQIAVQVALTGSTSPAYSSGDAIGGLMTIANAARVSGSLGASGTGGILQNIAINSKSVQSAAMEVWIFNANPSGSTCTDNAAFVLATADFDKVIGVAAVPSTAANNSGWFSGGTGSVGQANNQAMAYDLSSATSLFACLVVRGTPTLAATTDISVKFNLLRN